MHSQGLRVFYLFIRNDKDGLWFIQKQTAEASSRVSIQISSEFKQTSEKT